MIIVEPMPSELGIAHAGRISYLTGFSTLAHFRHETLGKSKNHRKRGQSRQQFTVVAARLGIDPEAYLAKHSLLPFSHACPSRKRESYRYQDLVNRWLKPADGPLLKHLRFCLECARQDALDAGIGWWRREHQLPGVDICIHHHEPLNLVQDDRAAERLPSYYIGERRYIRETSPDSDDEIVARYRALAISLLELRIEPSHLRVRVGQRCIEHAIGRDRKHRSSSTSLSRHVRSRFPHGWMQKHRPTLVHPDYAGRDLMIDAGFSGQGAPGMAIVMVLASLFDDFDDLNIEPTTPIKANRSPRFSIEINSSDSAIRFASLFVAMHGDCHRIAREIGRTYGTAVLLRRRFGFPAIPRLWTAAHDIAFERILAATDIDLATWATAMHQYWKTRSSIGPTGADLAEFLRISET
ncbi:TniQ family protein [Paraburkholderia bryophila]|uniref:TniQ family protein n=1 Tax=Paraburkholderia bryophila TaxID=420952 RepID=UPI00234BDE8C|nr:TniQ family protein [Paraburkholderia bryophila]WCM23626.1 TniQ family protein [Paraburkholderia bryophila]